MVPASACRESSVVPAAQVEQVLLVEPVALAEPAAVGSVVPAEIDPVEFDQVDFVHPGFGPEQNP